MKSFIRLTAVFIIYLLLLGSPDRAHAGEGNAASPGATATDHLIATGSRAFQKGDFESAASAWAQVIAHPDLKENPGLYTDTATHLAGAYQALGYHQRALAVFRKAMPASEAADDPQVRALFLNGLGDLWFSLGDVAKAADFLNQSAEAARQTNNPFLIANVLNNVGNLLAVNGYFESAMASYAEALDLIDQVSEPESGKALPLAELRLKILVNVVRLSVLSQQYEEAALAFGVALKETGKLSDSHTKAQNLIALGDLGREIRKGKPDLANGVSASDVYQAFDEARRIAAALNDARTRSYACGYLGRLYEDEQRYAEAMRLTRSALFFSQHGDFPDIRYLWEWQMGRLSTATGNTEGAIARYREAVDTLSGIRTELLQGYRSQEDTFSTRIRPVYLGLADVLLRQAGASGGEEAEAGIREARDVMERLKMAELEDFFEDECVTARSHQKATLDRTPQHTAVLCPIIFADRLTLLLTLPDGITQTNVPVDAATLEETVRGFRRRLQTRPHKRFLYDARQLYDWLIRPVESELISHHIRTLVIAPDGVLRLIPFTPLHDGEGFLIEKYAVGTIPAIRLTAPTPLNKKNIDILLGGLSESVQEFSALPSVPGELADVREIMGGETVIQNQAFNAENLTGEIRKKAYSVLHLATHGVFGGLPEETFLLTYDGRLTINQLEQLIGLGRFREKQMELLTLSACQTALGDERAALGLAGVAVKAGVRSAVATLWFVDDEATSLVIREFYRQLVSPGISRAEALQNAQKKLIAQKRYWHPAYWAPFLLIGNWM